MGGPFRCSTCHQICRGPRGLTGDTGPVGSTGPSGPANLRLPSGQTCIGIIQGRISVDIVEVSPGIFETVATVLNGTGFVVSTDPLDPLGTVHVTLVDPPLINPAVTASVNNVGFNVFVNNQSGITFELGSGIPAIINFHAIGPCPPSTNPS